MNESEALRRLELMVDSSGDPALTFSEVAGVLGLAKVPDHFGNLPTNTSASSAWESDTSYLIGATVTASTPAGRWWTCITPGASGATEPTWPSLAGLPRGQSTVTDGTVVWLDAGSEWAPTWDLNYAAELGWEMKAGRAAGRFDFTTDGQTFRRGQVITNCQQMAARFRRKRASNAPVEPPSHR